MSIFRPDISRYCQLFALAFVLFSCQEKQGPIRTDYKLIIPETQPSVTLFFCGDIIQHLPQIYDAHVPREKDYNYLKCFRYIAPYWQDADIVIANLETTLTDKDFSGYPLFSSPWQIARDLHRLGLTAFVTANNHCCDRGGKGIAGTVRYLDSLGIAHTGIFTDTAAYGARNPLYFKQEGFKIALLNYTYGTNGLPVPKGFVVSPIDTNAMKRDIQKARLDSATNIIAFMHWGYEYHTRQNKEQEELADWLHGQGADIVVGSHPHVVQPIRYTLAGRDTTGITVFSLGNFISNQSYQGTDGGICIRLTLTRDAAGKTGYTMHPIKFYTYRPFEEGRRRYYVVPEALADSIMRAPFLTKGKRFFRKTDSILSSYVRQPY